LRAALSRGLQLLGLLVTGTALLVGLRGGHPILLSLLGGPIRAELTLLAVGVVFFYTGLLLRKAGK
jgi:hypothetical protein